MAKLLFFDTFHQDCGEGDNSVSSGWSIINFPCFVVIEEILIVPNGSRISDLIPLEGRRHGETHPPQFRVDFFACEANNQLSSTYEKLCMIDYNENTRTTVLPRLPFILNQLLCNGWYKSMTIAVFGSEAGDSQAVHLIHERRAKGMNLTSEVLIRPKQPDINFLLPPQHMQPPNMGPPPFPPNNQPPPQMQPPVSVQQQVVVDQGQQRNNFNFNNGGGGGGRNDFFMKNMNDEQQQYGGGYGDDRQRHGNRRKMYNNNNRRDQLDSSSQQQQQQRHIQQPDNRTNEVMAKQIHSLLKKVRGDESVGCDGSSEERRHTAQQSTKQMKNKVRFQSPEYWRGNRYSGGSGGHNYNQQQSSQPVDGATDQLVGGGDGGEMTVDADGCHLHDDVLVDDDDDVIDDLLLPQTMMNFNPFEVDVYPLYYFRPPEETAYENLLLKDNVDNKSKEYKKLKAAIKKYSINIDEDREVCVQNLYDSIETKEWILMLEEITPLVNPHLSRVEKESENDARQVAFWAVAAIILDGPLFGKMCHNVRVIKAGLNLILNLTQTNEQNVSNMCEFGLINELYTLLRGPYISTTIKLAALHCIDGLTNWPLHVDYILLGPREKDAKSGYVHLIEMVLERQNDRVAESLKRLLRKLHLYESMSRIGEETRTYANTALVNMQDDHGGSDDYDISDMLEVADQYDDYDEDSDLNKDNPTPPPVGNMEVDVSTATQLEHSSSSSTTTSGTKRRIRRNSAEIELSDSSNDFDEQITNQQQQQENKHDNNHQQHYHHPDESTDIRERMRSFSSSFGDYLSLDMVKGLDWIDDITNEELEKLAACLEDVEQVFSSPFKYIGQLPLKMMPIIDQRLNESMKAVIEKNTKRAQISLLRMSNHTELLPSILILLTLPRINSHPKLFRSCYRIITNLLNTDHGILHAIGPSNFAAVAQLSRNLMCSSVDLDIGRPGTAGHLGAIIACNMQVMQSMDTIGRILDTPDPEEIGPVDVDELLEALKSLYALHYLPWGKSLVAKALSLGKNFEFLLKCVWFMEKDEESSISSDGAVKKETADNESGEGKTSEKSDKTTATIKTEPTTTTEKTDDKKEEENKTPTTTSYKSAVNSYGSLLLLNVLKRNTEVGYLVKHAETLVERCVSGDFISTRSNELRQWLKPLTCVETPLQPTSSADVHKLMNVIKEGCGESETISSQLLASFCMTLRLLVERSGLDVNDDDFASCRVSIRQHESLLMLTNADGYNISLKLAEKLISYLQPLSRSNIPLPVNGIETHHTIISLLTNLLHLISHLSKHLINIAVKPRVLNITRLIDVVINLHSISYGILWSLDHPTLHQITRQSVTILARYIAPVNKNDVPKDCGETLVSAIVAHARLRCEHFLPALTLLTNLLPMPLPVSVSEEMQMHTKHYNSLLSVCSISRRRWAAIITPTSESVTSLLVDLMTSSCRPLLDVVVMCLQQIADLTEELALEVAKKLLEQLRVVLVRKKSAGDKVVAPLGGNGAAFIATMCEVLTLPAVKQAFLKLMGGDDVGDELWSVDDDEDVDDGAADDICASLLLMASVLLDDNISLLGSDNRFEVESRLVCLLPPINHLSAIADLAVSKFATCTKTASHLMENTTFVLMKLADNRLTRPFVHNAIVEADDDSLWRGTNTLKEMKDEHAMLTSLVNLINFLHSITQQEDNVTNMMGYPQLAYLFNQGDSSNQQLLLQLERALQVHVTEWADADSPESLALDYLVALRQNIACATKTSLARRKLRKPERHIKIELPPTVEFDQQFASRQTLVLGGGRDHNTRLARDVITSSPLTRVDGDSDRMVTSDLVELGEKVIGKELDLGKDLRDMEKAVADMRKKCDDMSMEAASQDQPAVSALVSSEAYSALSGKKLTYAKRSHGLLFQHHHGGGHQQMHHHQRNKNNGGMGGMHGNLHHRVGAFNPHNRPHDLFRHRKQNTSRLPSMHVDDYMAADEQQQQQQDNQVTNNMTGGAPNVVMNQRGRGGMNNKTSVNQRLGNNNNQQQRQNINNHHQQRRGQPYNVGPVNNFSRGGGYMGRRGGGFTPGGGGQRRFDNQQRNFGNNQRNNNQQQQQQNQSVRNRLGFQGQPGGGQRGGDHFNNNKLQRSNNENTGGSRYNDGGGRFGGGRYYMPKYGGGNKRNFNAR